jgi:hypothetical protein
MMIDVWFVDFDPGEIASFLTQLITETSQLFLFSEMLLTNNQSFFSRHDFVVLHKGPPLSFTKQSTKLLNNVLPTNLMLSCTVFVRK